MKSCTQALRLTALLALALPMVAAAQNAPAAAREPKVERLVTEDNGVRIEELRVRGVTQSISVHSKAASAPAYEIVTREGGQDPSKADGRAAGRSVWSVLKF